MTEKIRKPRRVLSPLISALAGIEQIFECVPDKYDQLILVNFVNSRYYSVPTVEAIKTTVQFGDNPNIDNFP